MKLQRILFALFLSIQFGSLFAQSTPQGMNYQALIRDDAGNPLTNHTFTVQVSIIPGGAAGTPEFVERHTVNSNEFGLFNIVVGGGIPVLNTFTSIDWATADQWMKVDVDLNAGNVYTTLSNTKLLSVPFALYAENASLFMDDLKDVNAVPVYDDQVLKWDGIAWVPATDNDTKYQFGGGLTEVDYLVETRPHTGDAVGMVDLTVVGLQGYSLSNATPQDGEILKWNGGTGQWEPSPDANTLLTAGNGISITSGVISNSIWTQSGINAIRTNGKVGIGTTSPAADLEVAGSENNGVTSTLRISSKTSPEYLLVDADEIDASIGLRINKNFDSNITLAEGGGKVGIGLPTPINPLDVRGGINVGMLYAGTHTAPPSGALIEGIVGIGTSTPKNKLDVEGNLAVGAGYSGNLNVPVNGAAIQGKLGVGTEAPASKMDISGNLTVGDGYAGVEAAPLNGALIEGWLGIGTPDPVVNLHVDGDAYITGTLALDGDLNLAGKVRMLDTTQSYDDTTGTLVVSGGVGIMKNANVGGDFKVWNTTESTDFNSGAIVTDGGAGIEKRLNVGGIATIENTTPSSDPTDGAFQVKGGAGITNQLNVGGIAKVWNTAGSGNPYNGALQVNGGTGIAKELNVGSWARIYSTAQSSNTSSGALRVEGGIGLKKNLHVGGNGYINQSLKVNQYVGINANPSTSYRLNVNGGGGFLRTADNGRTEIRSNTGGHALSVYGPNNGIEVQVAPGVPNSNNNFITFKNGSGGTVGRIEGQNESDLASDYMYIYETTILAIDVGVAAFEFGGAITDVRFGGGFGAVVISPGIADIASAAAGLALAGTAFGIYQANMLGNLGVTYSSGSGDYAEWLERMDPLEEINAGQIVGVFGGKVTRNTNKAQQIMVVSTDPIILGNMPNEEKELARYEKIAFVGQVPVKVVGPTKIGDFIIPSGLNDGTGIAISPELMTADEFTKIVGRAWSASADPGLKLINVAVGVNQGDVATAVKQQERKNQAMMQKLENLEAKVSSLETQAGKIERLESESAELHSILDYLKSEGMDLYKQVEARK